MADAKIETVKKSVETEVQEDVYTLTLNRDEAQTLYTLLGNIAGSASTTYNKHTYSIWSALGKSRGIRYGSFNGRFTIGYNSITAKDLPDSSSF